MDKKTIRTALDIPVSLHRRLHEAAARQGCSARQFILRSIDNAIAETAPVRRKRRLSLDPLVAADGRRRFDLTNEQIYELIEFP